MTKPPAIKLNAYLPPKTIPLPALGWIGGRIASADSAMLRVDFLTGAESGHGIPVMFMGTRPGLTYDWDCLNAWMNALGTGADRFARVEDALAACVGKHVRMYVSRYKMRQDSDFWSYRIEALQPVTDAEAGLMMAEHDMRKAARGGSLPLLTEKTLSTTAMMPTADRFNWEATDYLQPREWLFGRYLLRRELSVLVGDGGVGKSSFFYAAAIAMASGKAVLGFVPPAPMNVWIMSFEEEGAELRRRVHAFARAHGLTQADIGSRLMTSGKDRLLCIASGGSGSVNIDQEALAHIEREIAINSVDVLFVDPFASTHRANEQDNTAMQAVAKAWVNVATNSDCAVFIAHHTRKLGGDRVTVDDMRGAVALKDTARVVLEFNPMGKAEADKFGVPHPNSYFSISTGKANFTARSNHQDWYEVASQAIPQADGKFGEIVGVVKPWRPPVLRFAVTPEQLTAIGVEIAKGISRKDPQAKDYVGNTVALVVGIRADDKPAMAGIKALIRRWLNDEALVINKRPDAKRELKEFVDLGNWSSAISSLGE